MDCHKGLLYVPNFNVLYSSTRSRSLCVRPRTKFRRRGSNSPQRSPSVAASGYCVVSGSEDGERPWNRSSQIHSAPKMCASVSRTEEKLLPMGLVNCSGVSAAAALSERRLAQALYSYSWRISSGDMAWPHKLDFISVRHSNFRSTCDR